MCDPNTWSSLLGPEQVALRLAVSAKLVCGMHERDAASSIVVTRLSSACSLTGELVVAGSGG